MITATIPAAMPSATEAAVRRVTVNATSTSTPRYMRTRVNSRKAFSSEAAQLAESRVSRAKAASAPIEISAACEGRRRGQAFNTMPIAIAHQAAIATAERSVSW
jgi:hypothetical protein